MFSKGSSSSPHPFGGGAKGGYPIQTAGGSAAPHDDVTHGGNMFSRTRARGGRGLIPPQGGSNPSPGGSAIPAQVGGGHAAEHGQRTSAGSTSFQGSPLDRAKKLFKHWGLNHPFGGGGSNY